jgi:endonuclease/exonuclease/phosphatase family metal-dependent hydrolase
MKTKALLLWLALASLPFTAHSAAYTRVLSWNTLHMGWSGHTDWTTYASQVWNQYGSSSGSSNGLDLIFLQEVMYDTAPPSFVAALEAVSGDDWNYAVTAAVGRSSYKERYAVVYRTDRIQLLSSTLYNDVGDKFEREPQIVKVRDLSTNADFTFINWHTIFGTTAERTQEAKDIVTVFNAVQNGSGSDQDVVLLGDHNYDATHSAWANLKSTSYVSPQVGFQVNVATTLNSSCAYASAYDHFWYQSSYLTEYSSSGRDYLANTCGFISDHAPVWLKLYSSSDTD